MNSLDGRSQWTLGLARLILLRVAIKANRVVALTLIAAIPLCSAITAGGQEREAGRPFTIKDSIEISYIVNPDPTTKFVLRGSDLPTGEPAFSPDGKHFLLITQRGLLSSNHLESTIWQFDTQSVMDFVSHSGEKPNPKPVLTLSAQSNVPVISCVRWLDSSRISFLGKKDGPYQQLFVFDVNSETLTPITNGSVYVSMYDVVGSTIAYSTLIPPDADNRPDDDLIDVSGKDFYSLLYPQNFRVEDLDEAALQSYPNSLHVMRNGQNVPVSFTFGGKPLKLSIPTLSLSPDGKSLITVAPVQEIPAKWGAYQTIGVGERRTLADSRQTTVEQYVIVNLSTGVTSPLVNAPAGRSLGYWGPTKTFWFANGLRAILSNTFLPLDPVRDSVNKSERSQAPSLAIVNISTSETQAITYFSQSPPPLEKQWFHVSDVSWDEAEQKVTLINESGPDPGKPSVPARETYRLISGKWTRTPTASQQSNGDGNQKVELSVFQDLNHAPVLLGRIRGGAAPSLVWDPNPQLRRINLGMVSLERWKDKNGNSWSGILALPPSYDPKLRYPLVIQTYSYNAKKFFTDGQYTTGYGGRALAAKGIIVLQMERPTKYIQTPQDGPYQVEGFESAIDHLAATGLIDRRRVGVIGFSYTCFLVLYAITQRPDLFAAASITDGVNMSYVKYVMATDQTGVQSQSEKANGARPFGEGLMKWFLRSPGFNLDRVKTPLLISAFERGQLIDQWEIYSGLRRLEKPVDMVWWRKENTPHLLVQPAQRYASQQSAVDWFAFWLKGEEDRDIIKVAQYSRWRELRRLQEKNETTPTGSK